MAANYEKSNIINHLKDYLIFSGTESDGITLVRKSRLNKLLELLLEKDVEAVIEKLKQDDVPEDLFSEDFRQWVIQNRQLASLTQTRLAAMVKVRPEQISRYEKGTHPLNEIHLKEIKRVLRPN